MMLIEDLRRDLDNARAIAQRDHSDLRHGNPGRIMRQEREAHHAMRQADKLSRALAIAKEIDEKGIAWKRQGDWIHFVVDQGNATHPVAGEFTDAREQFELQVETILSNPPGEQKKALVLAGLDTDAAKDLKWVRDRLAGVSVAKFRRDFLVTSGLLMLLGDELTLTSMSRDHGLLEEHEGQFGPWFRASALCIAWIYSEYLAGHVPMTGKVHHGPLENVELAAILASHKESLEALPVRMRAI